MRVFPSRIFLWVCLLFITQSVFVESRSSRKDRKKNEEEPAPDPVTDEENSDPATSGREARQHTNQSGEGEGSAVNPEEDADNDNGEKNERTKKSYCATGRSHDENYNGGGHPHGPHGPYGRTDGPYQPDMDQYHGGGHGPGYGPHGYMPHGPDAPDYHHAGHGHYEGHEGYGGDGGKGHINPGFARKSQGEYGYGGQASKGGGDQYHVAASAPSSVYRPSYQTGHDPYGGGSDYSPSYGYGGHGPSYNAAPYAGAHSYPGQHDHYAPQLYGPHAPGYGAGHIKSAYGSGIYPPPPAYGPAYGVAPMYGPMYHGPSGYPPAAGYPPHASYNPYMPYNSPSPSYQYGAPYPVPPYSQPYGYGPSPGYQPPPPYQLHGPHPGIPVTLTCSLQQHDARFGYPPHPRGNPTYYRASDSDSHPSKPPFTMVMVPANHTKIQKPNEKPAGKDQSDEPILEGDKDSKDSHPAMATHTKPEGIKGDPHAAMPPIRGGGGGPGPQAPARESASYPRMPFSLIRQRQMESLMGPKQVFYQPNY